jgi:opacity protein-like surface antigen
LGISILFFATNLFSQERRSDSSRYSKKNIHLIGLQANALFKQIFNFGNANNPVNNPYLLTYSFINKKTKLGFDAGVGYTLNSIFENDGNTKKENNINDLYFRLGMLKLIPLNRKFSASVQIHFLLDLLNSKTTTESDFGSQISKVNSNSSSMRYGLGPCLGLRYKVSNRVFVGTEASYYFRMGKVKSKVTNTTSFGGQILQSTVVETDNDLIQFMFNVPTAIYLSINI